MSDDHFRFVLCGLPDLAILEMVSQMAQGLDAANAAKST